MKNKNNLEKESMTLLIVVNHHQSNYKKTRWKFPANRIKKKKLNKFKAFQNKKMWMKIFQK